jgi:hypothetical protein
VPDEIPRPAPLTEGPPPPIDFVDLLCDFAHAYPGWLRPDGRPLSWRHFIHGLAHLDRARARLSMRIAGAVAIARTSDEAAATDWWQRQRAAAGPGW